MHNKGIWIKVHTKEGFFNAFTSSSSKIKFDISSTLIKAIVTSTEPINKIDQKHERIKNTLKLSPL